MRYSLVLSWVALLLATCSAQVPNVGWCPDYVPMSNFDMERFLGKWYEAERYFQVSELGTRCVVSDYAKSPNGKIYVSNEVTSRITGVKRILGGDLEPIGRTGEGKLKVRYQTTPISTTTTLNVLDTDYENYAVLWSCIGYGPVHTQNAWVMTRERLPPGTVLQKAYGVLDRYKISRTFFQRTDQEGCVLAASEINAAQGWVGEQTVPETNQVGKEGEEEPSEKSAEPIMKSESSDKGAKISAAEPIKPEEKKLPLKKDELPLKGNIAAEESPEKPVKVAEHIMKNAAEQPESMKIEEMSKEKLDEKKATKPEEIPEKKPETKRVSPKHVHSHHRSHVESK